jgi:gp16 family phage-associated protein
MKKRMSIEQNRAMEESRLRTVEEARNWFTKKGLSVVDWSIARGFNPTLVYSILQGKRKCLRGQSHRIALALRLKEEHTDDS